MNGWKGQAPKLTPEQYRVLVEWKAARKALPSLEKIAAQIGVPISCARNAVRRGVKRFDHAGSSP